MRPTDPQGPYWLSHSQIPRMEILSLLSSASCLGYPVTSNFKTCFGFTQVYHSSTVGEPEGKKKKKQPARDQLGIRKRNIQPDLAFRALLSGQARGWWSTIPHPSPFRSIQHSHPSIFIFCSITTSLRIISILQMGKLRLKVLDRLGEVGHKWGVRIQNHAALSNMLHHICASPNDGPFGQFKRKLY